MSTSNFQKYLKPFIFCLVILDLFIWYQILFVQSDQELALYFLDVGQGDSQLINFPGGAQILIDGGPNSKVLDSLARAMPLTDRYLDLVALTHPQLDHYGGLIEVLKNYKIGAFITSGRSSEAAGYQELLAIVKEKKIPLVFLRQKDRIRYLDNILEILSPSFKNLSAKDLNDSSLVAFLKTPAFTALYTGDIGFKVEKELSAKYDLTADILKVPHHGSKYSSSAAFLQEVNPKLSVIGVGKNTYGHPTKETLGRLASVHSAVTRTDRDGLIQVKVKAGNLAVFSIQ